MLARPINNNNNNNSTRIYVQDLETQCDRIFVHRYASVS